MNVLNIFSLYIKFYIHLLLYHIKAQQILILFYFRNIAIAQFQSTKNNNKSTKKKIQILYYRSIGVFDEISSNIYLRK